MYKFSFLLQQYVFGLTPGSCEYAIENLSKYILKVQNTHFHTMA